jgi:hypothetical protein
LEKENLTKTKEIDGLSKTRVPVLEKKLIKLEEDLKEEKVKSSKLESERVFISEKIKKE